MRKTAEKYMQSALSEAKKAYKLDEVPVGAVAVLDGKIIARAHNLRESNNNPVAHAEILCLQRAAKKVKSWRLENVTLYVTLEPCVMCMSALLQARVKQLVYGANDPKAGAHKSKVKLKSINPINQKLKVTAGILKDDCAIILKKFFKNLRKKKK
ncbi:MAG: tRNA adenosine(34) deaminase TadA [Candidatus Margulisbacteria bacterium]|nr:tRNA adenosine(34) deaminase TadA [Candidatus Margulisiibacteriota bacterium]MBU1021433.1 tRNA adenosine(34) deaminase TadA [Candidatus Margulisiibacteriota bacterium]MBU1728354.1 tRNA adenosine(34) deaminase TadA [Candidatus Margulisiibacteriota bacterium]MBU1955903.1 tRNA adenosine(34) deaminase TadA [Candidatus Margulisiibacteriota bacterium]